MALVELHFPADYLAAQGHFPGNPVIPGAALLSEVLFAISSRVGVSLPPCRITAAKFLHPTRPGDTISVEFIAQEGRVEFTGRLGEKLVMKGEVQWDTGSAAS